MNRRSIVGVFKANLPQFVWLWWALYIGAIIFGLDGSAPQWGPIILFFVTATILLGIAEYANTYADRHEDSIYLPSSPLITGELDEGTAKRAFILQNILGGLLLIAMLVLTLSYNWYDSRYWLPIALAAGWAVGLTYSLPPLRFKERAVGPFLWSLGFALTVIVAWLCVASLNNFIIAFVAFWFVVSLPWALSMTKLRKTFDALMGGHIQLEEGKSVWDLKTVGFISVKTAVVFEVIVGLGAFIMVPIFWHLGIFNMPLSVTLLTLPLAFQILTVVFRLKDPANNTRKCEQFAGMACAFVILSFFGVALASVVHWGFAILACVVFFVGFSLLFKVVHPFGPAYRAL